MAPNDKEHPILRFLRSPLLPFTFQSEHDADAQLTVQPERKGTTSTWGRQYLGKTTLRRAEIELETYCVKDFVKAVNKFPASVNPPVTPSKHMCLYPRTEEDTSTAVYTQILNAIMEIAVHDKLASTWFPNTNYPHLCISPLDFRGELISEAYARSRSQNLPGVRVDRLFITTALLKENYPGTRQHYRNLEALELPDTPPQNTFEDVRCQNKYLRRGEVWRLGSLSKFNWPSQKRASRALLPVEIKKLGSIDRRIFEWLAANGIKIGPQDSQNLDVVLRDAPLPGYNDRSKAASAIRGTLSMIQQALRYGACYGVEDVIITDYECGILMQVPPWMERVADKGFVPPTEQVRWTFIGGAELRLVIASVLWKACQSISSVMDDAEEAAAEAEAEAKKNTQSN